MRDTWECALIYRLIQSTLWCKRIMDVEVNSGALLCPQGVLNGTAAPLMVTQQWPKHGQSAAPYATVPHASIVRAELLRKELKKESQLPAEESI